MADQFQRGEICKPSEVYRFLQHMMQYNIHAAENNLEKLVACIWGHAGISKTATIRQLETVGVMIDGERVFPKVHHIALAQIEEAGDITGLPDHDKRQIGVDEDGAPIWEKITSYLPPAWWPEDDGNHHVLLFDDFNRANPSILKAIMQLLQDYKTNTRSLPQKTSIMLTGNPSDEGDYMVNEIDKAILTRMCHITMKFDKVDWATWAKGNDIDDRVVSFVLGYEELCDGTHGTRTNPRSVVQFARLISPLKDLKGEIDALRVLGRACMDDSACTAFEKFVIGDMQHLVSPEEILNNYEKSIVKIESLKTGFDGQPREDLIGIINDRLFVHLMQPTLKLTDKQQDNFIAFCKRTDLMPRDMLYTLARRLRQEAEICGDEEKFKSICDLIEKGGDALAELLASAM